MIVGTSTGGIISLSLLAGNAGKAANAGTVGNAGKSSQEKDMKVRERMTIEEVKQFYIE